MSKQLDTLLSLFGVNESKIDAIKELRDANSKQQVTTIVLASRPRDVTTVKFLTTLLEKGKHCFPKHVMSWLLSLQAQYDEGSNAL